MNIHFKLRAQGKSQPKIILVIFDSRFKGRKFMFSTGLCIAPVAWDKRKERSKMSFGSKNEIAQSTLNQILDEIEQKAIAFLSERHGNNRLSRNELKAFLSQATDGGSNRESIPEQIFKTWESIILSTKSSNGVPITQGTVRSKTQTLNLLKEFTKAEKFELSFEAMDMNFYHQFDDYMCRQGLSGNTRGKHFKEIKAVLREAADRGININTSFQKKSFRVIRAKPDNIYLNENEIKKIFLLDLSSAQSRLRDIFVMAAYSGLRHSDWDQLRKENIITERSMQMLRIQQKKTNDIVYIPIHSAVRQILEKYTESPPKVISNQKFNEALKMICKKADLGVVNIDGKSFEKWELVSTHTARRSFATNAYLSKSMDVYQIMNCTGHKSESSFLRYLKLDGRDFAIQAAESKFFKDDNWNTMKIAS